MKNVTAISGLLVAMCAIPTFADIKVQAYVDGKARLHIEDDRIYWEDLQSGTAHPGWHDEYQPLNYDENGPTWLDDQAWTPVWYADGGNHRSTGYSSSYYGDFSWVTGIELGTLDDLTVFDNYIFWVGSPSNITNYAETPSPINCNIVFDSEGILINDTNPGAHRYVFSLVPEPATLSLLALGGLSLLRPRRTKSRHMAEQARQDGAWDGCITTLLGKNMKGAIL